ncbi:hypothetical protein AB0D42_07420 [Streptomyces sp. NPDC048304]|uniref:hypothetical protein n=1 Tax=Streptomyces sp. NPDC048304 TaxID=3154820 RepID=UPI003409A01C
MPAVSGKRAQERLVKLVRVLRVPWRYDTEAVRDAFMLRLPAPVFGWLLGREWCDETRPTAPVGTTADG